MIWHTIWSSWWWSLSIPTKYADVVTSTTHAVLRGPRGGIILTNNEELAKNLTVQFSLFARWTTNACCSAKAVCFKEALSDEFKVYTKMN